MDDRCQSVTPELGIPCGKRPHPERYACSASGTSSDGVHWTLIWWRPGGDGDQRADGRPCLAAAGEPLPAAT